MGRRSSAVVALLGLAALVGCGEEPIPVNVSYSRDIAPLMTARCIRCHGAGGKLNDDPASVKTAGVTKPNNGDFTRLDSYTDSTGKMINGLSAYTGTEGVKTLKAYVDTFGMPPKPAPELTDREHDMLFQWAAAPLP
jgi:hypothetical protein